MITLPGGMGVAKLVLVILQPIPNTKSARVRNWCTPAVVLVPPDPTDKG